MVAPLLDALSVIHQADFLHRDIAPDNIIVRRDATPVLIDFGSARGEIAQHTRTISALVKPGYSPYEQYAETGKKQGPWTDIYALAGTLYHAVTGKRPPDSPSRIIKDDLQTAEQAAVGAFRPRFLQAIDRGLRLDIDQRPQSIGEWRGGLLAPDDAPAQSSWLPRRLVSRTPEPEPEAAANDAPTRMITAPMPIAPLPDVPGQTGQFPDFVEQLKAKTGGDAPEPPASPVKRTPPAPIEPDFPALPPPRTSLRSRLRLGWGGAAKPAPGRPQASEPEVPGRRKAEPAAAELLPAPVEPIAPPRVLRKPRPRPIRRFGAPRWRPLLFKLLIGIGVASGAVALQDRIPQFEFRGTGSVSSSSKNTPSTKASRKETTKTAASAQPARPKPAPLLLNRFAAHQGEISKLHFAKNGRLILTTGTDGSLKIWDTGSQALLRTLEMDDGPATSLAARGNIALTGHSEGVVALWDLDTGLKQRAFKRNDANIWALKFAGSDRFWSAAHDWTVTLWELNTPSAPAAGSRRTWQRRPSAFVFAGNRLARFRRSRQAHQVVERWHSHRDPHIQQNARFRLCACLFR